MQFLQSIDKKEVNELQVKEALDHYFQKLLEYWNDTFGVLPQIPFDDEMNPLLYESEQDEDDYVSWKPKIKEKHEDFEAIETYIDVRLHPSIKEYFQSFWFLNLQGFYHSKFISLEPVEPDKDMHNFFVNQKNYEASKGKTLKNIQIGFLSPENMALMVHNETGEILQEDFETGETIIIAKSLEALIRDLRISR